MSKQEQNELLQNMHQRTKSATASKEAAVKYLVDLGVLTKAGNYTKAYRDLCTKSKAA